MFAKRFSYAGALLVAAAVIAAVPSFGWARGGGGGGGHGGGGHFGGGGGHFGGGFGGGHFGGGFGGGHFGGGHFGGFHHGGFGYGYPSYGLGYGLYGYPSYDYSYSDSYPYANYGPVDDSEFYGSNGYTAPYDLGSTSVPPMTDYQSYYPPVTATTTEADDTAHVTVRAPANAELWFDGTKTSATGSVREFRSPPLAGGGKYSYEIQARWNDNGHQVTQTKKVEVSPGGHVNVMFPAAPTPSGAGAQR